MPLSLPPTTKSFANKVVVVLDTAPAAGTGIPTTVRDTRGREIDGACGQLAAKQ